LVRDKLTTTDPSPKYKRRHPFVRPCPLRIAAGSVEKRAIIAAWGFGKADCGYHAALENPYTATQQRQKTHIQLPSSARKPIYSYPAPSENMINFRQF
jgi:hypothetical protein